MRSKLASYKGVVDIDDTFDRGKREMIFKVNELGKSYGLTNQEIARQVRAAFYGAEAMKFQRGLEEVTVRVQYPKSDKEDRKKLNNMFIRTSDGKEYPFYTVADVEEGSALASIERTDRKQVVNVTAMAASTANPAEIMRDLEATILPEMTKEYPGLTWAYGGEEEQKQESRKGLGKVMPLIFLIMYAMLAIPFRSYIQPVIVLMAIPFGLVGAIIGHMSVGIPISMMSIFGMVAVGGVVVNDSIVMVDFINRFSDSHGHVTRDTLIQAGMRRFRPILMTSLTTFFGLAPIILEKSVHAQLLIPMAVSLAFGVLFTTVIALCFVPSVYMILEDFKKLLKI
jgi:multidrug efflux pump subunit AcrB